MPLVKRVKSAFLFPNGNLAACDSAGEHIPELQGPYSIDKHKRILLEATDDCEFNGFQILPGGFCQAARDWSDHFRKQNMSYEEIQAI